MSAVNLIVTLYTLSSDPLLVLSVYVDILNGLFFSNVRFLI